jgi:hypothetical protein
MILQLRVESIRVDSTKRCTRLSRQVVDRRDGPGALIRISSVPVWQELCIACFFANVAVPISPLSRLRVCEVY